MEILEGIKKFIRITANRNSAHKAGHIATFYADADSLAKNSPALWFRGESTKRLIR